MKPARHRFVPLAGLFLVLAVFLPVSVFGQAFHNLNFEAAAIPSSTQVDASIPISEAFPAWSAYFTSGGITTPQSQITYDGISTGGGMISIIDARAETPLQGNYSAYLYGGGVGVGPGTESASISQTGTIQPGTQSLLFDAYFITTPVVAIDGQALNIIPLQQISFYTLYGASIPADDIGQPVTLSFTDPAGNLELDNISFSPAVVPEPSAVLLTGIGGLVFALHRRFRR